VDIGIPAGLVRELSPAEETIEAALYRGRLARRPDSHKGDYGHLFVLAGSAGKTGAACLTALGALRCGAGLVTVGIPESLNSVLEVKLTEAMSLPLPDTGKGTLSEEAVDGILRFAQGKKCIAVGPGLGTEPEVERVIREVWTRVECPMVWDADGLNLLARNPDLRGKNRAPVILTPHPGEMARLAASTTRRVQENRVETVKALAREWGVVAVLKGSRTLVADPGGRLGINLTGNPGMAAGGMGDVLTGMIASLVCQGLDPYDAACLGVHLHGEAGDRASKRLGPVGFMASDLLEEVPEILRKAAGNSQ
jgi:NAD(P)H-hydrate epimerase